MCETKQRSKTWGREVAFMLLCVLCVLAFQGQVEVIKVLVWPFMTFVFWAYGVVRNEDALSTIIRGKQ